MCLELKINVNQSNYKILIFLYILNADDANSLEDIGDISVESNITFGNNLIVEHYDDFIGDVDCGIMNIPIDNIGIAVPINIPLPFESIKDFDEPSREFKVFYINADTNQALKIQM